MLTSFRKSIRSSANVVPIILLSLLMAPLEARQSISPDSKTILEQTKAATVIVLAGEGVGRLTRIATGVTISKDGVLLTAFHAIKGADEVQIRIPNGEIFDHVELLGVDERRDIAALKISARALSCLPIGSTANLAPGEAVYSVTNGAGLAWSATEGILSSVRAADEMPGIESGFRLLQFNAPIAQGSSGGALVDHAGNLIGIITTGHGASGFAVPIEGVVGLADSTQHTPLGSGRLLQLRSGLKHEVPQSSAEIASLDYKKILQDAKTVYIASNTEFISADTMSHALAAQKSWPNMSLTVVEDQRVADLMLKVDRVIFTHVHTYSLIDRKTSIVLVSGRVRAFDGILASDGIAKEVIGHVASARH